MENCVKSALIVLACLLTQRLAAQIVHLPEPGDTTRVQFDVARDADTDIQNAIRLARRSGKNILLDVGGEWCSWCRKLDRFFLQNRDVGEFMHKNYVVVKVNYSKENKNERTLSRFPAVKGYPHFFVLDQDGKLLHSQDTGALESGDRHDREKVFGFLKEWAPEDSTSR